MGIRITENLPWNGLMAWFFGVMKWRFPLGYSLTAKLLHMLSIQSDNLSEKCHMKQVSEGRVKSRIPILLQPTCTCIFFS